MVNRDQEGKNLLKGGNIRTPLRLKKFKFRGKQYRVPEKTNSILSELAIVFVLVMIVCIFCAVACQFDVELFANMPLKNIAIILGIILGGIFLLQLVIFFKGIEEIQEDDDDYYN